MSEELKNLYDLGFKYEKEYGNCAQCSLAALMDFFGIEEPSVFKAVTALLGGTGGMGNGNCGAYCGCVVTFGLMYGRDRKHFSDREGAAQASKLARELQTRFMAEYGGVTCHDVQRRVFGRKFNMQDPREREAFETAGGHIDKCPSVVAKAVLWVGEIIQENEKQNLEMINIQGVKI